MAKYKSKINREEDISHHEWEKKKFNNYRKFKRCL